MVTLATVFSSVVFLGASVDAPIGWRTDGTGRYPAAAVPTVWGVEKNVRWKTPLPGRSQGSPIVVGERVFVVSDPAELLCVSAADGSIVWRRSQAPADLYGTEKAAEIVAEFKRFRTERQNLEKELNAVKEDKEKQEPIKARLESLKKTQAEFAEKFAAPPEFANGEVTNSAATPVSDGKRIYAVFGNGVVCAYTVDGEKVWAKYVEGPTIGFGSCSSPLVCDGRLVVHLNDLFALDAATGEAVWRVKLPARHASPLLGRVGETAVVISPAGAVVRCSDGKVLLDDKRLTSGECSSILHEGTLYRTNDSKAAALRLVADGAEAVKLELLWEEKIASGRRTPSSALHNGLLYNVNTDGLLDVLDAATGEQVFRNRLNVGSVYSSVTAAGDAVYFSGKNGTTVVLAAGREYEELARNELEPFGSCVVPSGPHLFIRTHKHLFCITASPQGQ
jgi:outer membrane protein assembly factor BamB